MARVLGIDATHPRGWLGVSLEDGHLAACTYRLTLEALLAAEPDAQRIAVNLPLGHDDPEGNRRGGERTADVEAAKLLDGSAPFVPYAPPIAFGARTLSGAHIEARERGWPAPAELHWLHKDRIAQLLALARSDRHIVEAIPAASWALLADELGAARPVLPHDRKTGQHERLVLLHEAALRPSRIFGGIGMAPGPYVLLEATICAWTAARVAAGTAKRLGETEPAVWA